MRTFYASVAILLAVSTHAQCPHDPVVSPDNLILCPNEGGLLSTQTADSYQWYRDGAAIPNAVQQTLSVSSIDAGSQFSVDATVEGCTEQSPPVLVDGWLFLLPFVMHAGDEPAGITPEGAYYCPGDTVLLMLMPPYTLGIQWTDNGVPIPGATDDTLVVTGPGAFNVSGAPEICPGFVQYLGVVIDVLFLDVVQPEIVESNGELCVSPQPGTFLWFLNGEPIGSGPCIAPAAAGSYTVAADYDGPCAPATSEPYIVMSLGERPGASLAAFPNPASKAFTIRSGQALQGNWRLVDSSGRVALNGRFQGCTECGVELSEIEPGCYVLFLEAHTPLRVSVQH